MVSVELKLNIGCGNRYLPGWENLDFRPVSPDVKPWDLRKRLPYPDGSVDLVYSSHLLEHLSPEQAEALLRDSLRVLKPGGVVRVVVPDLEALARNYLCELDKMREESLAESQRSQRGVGETADHGLNAINKDRRTKTQEPAHGGNQAPSTKHQEHNAAERYDWSVIFLLDQLVRTRCGGTMLARLAEYKGNPPEFLRKCFNSEWLESVLGQGSACGARSEVRGQMSGGEGPSDLRPRNSDLGSQTSDLLRRIALGLRWRRRALMEALERATRRLSPGMVARLDCWRTARFLAQGERHQWMYDEVSLGRLMEQVGLIDVRKRTCGTAARFEDEIQLLDMTQAGEAYQPDSLYMEGTAKCACSGTEA